MAREGKLTHLGSSGEARMVDVSDKDSTERVATAEGRVVMTLPLSAFHFLRFSFLTSLLVADLCSGNPAERCSLQAMITLGREPARRES